MNQNRVSTLLVLAVLVFSQSSALFHASASGQAGTINVFSNGQASIDISLTANNIDTNYSIEVPRNVTFESGQFIINANDEAPTPGQVSLDIGQDGIPEWAFDGTGFGDLGHQNLFMNNASYHSFLSNGTAQSMPFYLPYNSAVESATLDVSFTSQLPAGLTQIDNISTYEAGDLDNDTLEEVVVRANVLAPGSSVGPAITSLDWNTSTGTSLSTWVATCGAGELIVSDIDGDDYDDVLSVAPSDDQVCLHQTNSSTGILGNATPVSLSADLISAQVGDLDGDGYGDILSIHEGGVVSLRTYDSKNSNFKENSTITVTGNGTVVPAQLTSMYADYFNGTQGDFTALVTDSLGHISHVQWLNGAMGLGFYSFDGIDSEMIGGDFDQDGDIDLFSPTLQGYILAENNGTTWSTTSVLSSLTFINSTIADHDGDGAVSLLVPQLTSSDSNQQTLEGNISVFDISTTSLNATQTVLEPWSCPTDSRFIDMDGDGLLEHIVSAGEGTAFGLFIGSWNSIAMDIDANGQNDLTAAGYAGDGQSGTSVLEFEDPLGLLTIILSPLTSGQVFTTHDYDIKMSLLFFEFENSGTGTFNLSNMDIGYDVDFIVENNPAAVGNLTNIINQQQTGGTGDITIDLPFLSTKSGTLSISSLHADYIPGAPNLALPPTPELVIEELSPLRITIAWQDVADFGSDLIEFELFKVSQGAPFDLNNPIASTTLNSSVDSDFFAGQSYDYAVRSLHAYGVTSNLSSRLSVTIPFPAPPTAIQGLTVVDTPGDNGGSLDLAWDALLNTPSDYRVFVESTEILSLENLTELVTTNTPSGSASYSLNITTTSDGSPLVDHVDYWVAVVAYDEYGNTSEQFSSVGPVNTLNNSLRASNITLSVTSSGSTTASSFEMSALDSLNITATLTSEGEALPLQNMSLRIGAGDFVHSMQGTTDENGVWHAVSVDDLTELSASFSEFLGDAFISIEYEGTDDSATIQPADESEFSYSGVAVLRASLSHSTEPVVLNETGHYSVEALITPELPSQSPVLANVLYDWSLNNEDGNVTDSGSVEVKGGKVSLSGYSTGHDTLSFSLSEGQGWFSVTPESFSFSFAAHGVNDTGNEADNQTGNETNQPAFPDVTLAGTVSCEAATYAWEENSTDAPITCTLTNPNPFEVQIAFSWAVIPATPPPLSFEPDPLPSSGPILTMNANGTLEVTFTPIRNGPSDGLFPGLQGVGYVFTLTCMDDGTDRCSAMSSPSATTEGELQWTLATQLEVDEAIDTEPTDTKGGSGALIGGIIALLVLGGAGAAFVLLRSRPEEDDWYIEAEDEDEPATPVTKPSRSLGEIKVEGADEIIDDTPSERRPSLFDEVDGRGEIEDYSDPQDDWSPESEEEPEESSEADGITVDEEGTEWWEDEEGVWWYREDGWEDWAVWED